MSIRVNLLANYGGQIAASGLAFLLAPLFIRSLGLEAWGLIGVFALLSAWFNLLDLGLTPAVTREVARAGLNDRAAHEAAALARSVAVVYAGLAVLTAALVAAGAGPVAQRWLRLDALQPVDAAQAIAWMGVAVALRLFENLPRAVLTGAQALPLLNGLSTLAAVVRWVGGLALVVWGGAGVAGFFAWQAGTAALSAAAFAFAARRRLAPAAAPARGWRDFAALGRVRRFAGGIALASLLGFALGQIDKLLLTRLLPMAEFGAYLLAATLADALALIAAPLYAVMLPRFVGLFERGEQAALGALYLGAARWLGVVLVPLAALLVVFGEAVVFAWSGDAALARTIAPWVALLAVGRMLNATMQLPAALQTAAGWTALAAGMNAVAVIVLVPLVLWLVPRHGAVAYAWCWVALNVGYLVAGTWRMHQRLLPAQRGAWVMDSLLRPALAAGAVLGSARALDAMPLDRWALALALPAALAAAIAVAALAAALGARAAAGKVQAA